MTEERRIELAKVAHKYAEDARIAVRNVRRHAMDDLKHSEKDSQISKDEHHDYAGEIQELTDTYVGKIDEMLANKEKEITHGLGLNPSSDGQLVRVPIPSLTEERRIELAKVAHKYAEDARIAVRNVRRHAMDDLKHSEKDSQISKDEHHDYAGEIQELTDTYVGKIDEMLANKEKEITQV